MTYPFPIWQSPWPLVDWLTFWVAIIIYMVGSVWAQKDLGRK
jgi:hypothetical protein